jgi:hypothetical protein
MLIVAPELTTLPPVLSAAFLSLEGHRHAYEQLHLA